MTKELHRKIIKIIVRLLWINVLSCIAATISILVGKNLTFDNFGEKYLLFLIVTGLVTLTNIFIKWQDKKDGV